MSDHLYIRDVERYRSRTLPLAELLAANDHLAGCGACRELFESSGQLEATYSFVRGDLQQAEAEMGPHLAYEEMATYIDDVLNEEERRTVDIHLEGCRECATEVVDLRATRASILFREEAPRRGSSRAAAALFRLLHRPRYRIAAQVAGFLVIAALAVLAATISLRSRLAEHQAQLVELRGRNEALQSEIETSKHTLANLQAQLKRVQESLGETPVGMARGILIHLNDAGGQVTLDRRGKLMGLGFLGGRDERLVKLALTTGEAGTPALLARLVGRPKKLMGTTEASFTLLSPVGTVVLSDRPTLRWQPLNGASGYLVTVLDSDLNEVVTSPLLSETEWQVTRPLKRGGVYTWQVRALRDGEEIRAPAAREVKFKVLAKPDAAELERARNTYPGSHLILGTLYADAGLLDEAEQEFEALAQANPESQVAQQLLANLKKKRPQ